VAHLASSFGILKIKQILCVSLKFSNFWQFCKFEKSSIEMGEKIAAKFQKKEL